MARTAAILLAAGSGRRMRGAVADKVLARLAGKPVFAHTAAAFAQSGVADLYVVVYRDHRQLRALSPWMPTPALLVAGGRERQDSVANALAAIPPDIAYVFIHDCARPLIQAGQLRALRQRVARTGAIVLAHRVTDTIKVKAGVTALSRLRTLERARLWAMETPQVFRRELIARAYALVRRKKLAVTDDAAAVDLLGQPVALLENLRPNPKLTTPADLAYLEFLLRRSS